APRASPRRSRRRPCPVAPAPRRPSPPSPLGSTCGPLVTSAAPSPIRRRRLAVRSLQLALAGARGVRVFTREAIATRRSGARSERLARALRLAPVDARTRLRAPLLKGRQIAPTRPGPPPP